MNTAEQAVYQTEKLIKDNDEKLPEDVKTEVQADVDALKTALAADPKDIDAIKSALEKLTQSQQKLGEAIYAAASAESAAGEAGEGASSASNEDVVDAEVVDDEDEKK